MVRLLRAGAGALALLCLTGGVATADPLPVADVTQSAHTDDGWRLSAALSRMTINSVPNMAATAFTRDGVVTGKAAATIDGNGTVTVNSGTLVLGLQLGCQVDLSEGGSLDVGADAGISPGFNNGGNLLNVIGPYADVDGDASINLLPGTITNLGLGKKALKGRTPASGTTRPTASAAPIVPVGAPSTGSGASTSATPIVTPTVTTHG